MLGVLPREISTHPRRPVLRRELPRVDTNLATLDPPLDARQKKVRPATCNEAIRRHAGLVSVFVDELRAFEIRKVVRAAGHMD